MKENKFKALLDQAGERSRPDPRILERTLDVLRDTNLRDANIRMYSNDTNVKENRVAVASWATLWSWKVLVPAFVIAILLAAGLLLPERIDPVTEVYAMELELGELAIDTGVIELGAQIDVVSLGGDFNFDLDLLELNN